MKLLASAFVAIVIAGPDSHISAATHYASQILTGETATAVTPLAPTQINCPPGFILNGKNCEQLLSAPVEYACEQGRIGGNSCVISHPIESRCPHGATQSGKDCVISKVSEPIGQCPSGYERVGKSGCAARRPAPIVEYCEIGVLTDGLCVQIEKTTPITTTFCPPGYADTEKGCAKITEYDCTTVQSKDTAILPPPVFPPLVATLPKKPWKRQLGIKKFNIYAPPPIPIPPPSKAAVILEPVIEPKVKIVQQLCQRHDFAPQISETRCPEGYATQEKYCVRKVVAEPLQKCTNGQSVQNCFDVIKAPMSFSCNEGELAGGICKSARIVNPEVFCRTGAQAGNECIVQVPPVPVCPAGYTLDGGSCWARKVTEPSGVRSVPCVGKECFQ